MSQSRSTIRFVCSTCISPLEVKRRLAGTKIRCPWCHTALTVPQESRPDGPVEVYEVSGEAAAAAPPPAQCTVSFLCSLCGTRMDAGADQAGQTMACPDCGTPAVVPAFAPPAPPAPAAPPSPAVAGSGEVYGVLAGQDQPPPTAAEVYQRHIPVVCLLCHTRMHASEEQVGQMLVCPDCGTGNVVPAAEAIESLVPLAAVEGYEVAATDEAPSLRAAKDRREFTYECPHCRTRLQAGRSQAGQRMTCPDCGTTFAIPRPLAEAPKPEPLAESAATYAVVAPPAETTAADQGPVAAPPRVMPPPKPKSLAEARSDPSDRDVLPPRGEEPKMPSWPLVNGVFSFPFYRDSLVCWAKLAAVGIVVLAILNVAIILAMQADKVSLGPAGLATAGPAVAMAAGALYALGFACIVTLLYCIWASSSVLKIVTETANGVDRIEEWANQEFVEWAFEAMYLVNSVVLSILAGWGVKCLAPALPPGVVATAVFVLFPILLLSLLETGVAFNPISPPVLGSLFKRWWAWLGFYVLAAIVVACVGAAGTGLWLVMGHWSAIPSAILGTAGLMIYFRLLGRLGWYITGRGR